MHKEDTPKYIIPNTSTHSPLLCMSRHQSKCVLSRQCLGGMLMSPMKWKPMSLGGVVLIFAGALAQCLPTYKLRSDKEVEERRPGRLFSAIKMPSCASENLGINRRLSRISIALICSAQHNHPQVQFIATWTNRFSDINWLSSVRVHTALSPSMSTIYTHKHTQPRLIWLLAAKAGCAANNSA